MIETLSRSDLKPFKILSWFCASDPSFGVEYVRVYEDAGILKDEGDAHANKRLMIVNIRYVEKWWSIK
jgi:hypothetical protein